jgi:hypothetical protein
MQQLVAFDEAGNTGENLLDETQPVYSLAAVLDTGDAKKTVDDALAHRQASELKFSGLRKHASGQRIVVDLFASGALNPDNARVSIAHKPWMVAAKMVDLLVEPYFQRRGHSALMYASGMHLNMADALYSEAPLAVGPQLWRAFQEAFVELVRDFSDTTITRYLTVLKLVRAARAEDPLAAVFAAMVDSCTWLEEDVRAEIDQLDPALSTVVEQLGAWSDRLDEPFTVLHDDAKVVKLWANEIDRFSNPGITPATVDFGITAIRLPFKAGKLTFTASERTPAVQLADVVAGASLLLYSELLGGSSLTPFARQLASAGVGTVIEHVSGPAMSAGAAAKLAAQPRPAA